MDCSALKMKALQTHMVWSTEGRNGIGPLEEDKESVFPLNYNKKSSFHPFGVERASNSAVTVAISTKLASQLQHITPLHKNFQ